MKTEEITNKEKWENFLSHIDEKTFLNSWNWGEFQLKMGDKIWRLGIFDGGDLVAIALVVRVKAKRGTFLFVPHGPTMLCIAGNPKSEIRNPKQIQNSKSQILNTFLNELKNIAKKEGASFIRIAPILERNGENEKIFRELGFRTAPMHMHPEVTWELDITPSEDRLLAGMRKTTRYLIRQAVKNKDIEIIKSCNVEDVDKFYNLHKETVGRHNFTPFSLEYIKREFESFAPRPPDAELSGDAGGLDNEIAVFHGKYRGELIASAIIVFWQGAAYYHHGATSLKYPKIPVAHLLQWEIIKEAKRRGCEKYNFWGIAPDGAKNHPWAGLTLFKTGFGGEQKGYVKTQDLPLSWAYWPAAIFEAFRRKKRGL
ncbi:MAG: hypothetical protein A3A32_03000 [Candidatus Wildermuthbacteria bacterium RIFCSPLOWO2_01_FULL_48_35]|uniref:BioF2-like acetyltransferase domain-containing protein n=2 Tax=Candidatus Wildermuthiibacteriota TaxID=1817923 RepID=A0A1G2RNC1_9BACT|nr:MAG: Methicillin resistance protein [Parcubacteria group bacterium GW2011_GWA2_47_9]OHA66955.1 MAG: hypothetical protein A3D59_01880 [Candidatus Wildermuthbacteria bacterium RIFCSPHIGHO2_02_FULL_47_17]OHA73859.1 MAG: hypothetical protein A3A32_03000 [Candidatus Wildermuthbacteria bacterium RIFCSPLOWO2_01_FULL_48_35]